MTLYFNFTTFNTVWYRTRLTFLRQKMKQILIHHQRQPQRRQRFNRKFLHNFHLQKFQREHQHMSRCLMLGGIETWNIVFLMGLIANIPINILFYYQLLFGVNNTFRTQLTYFGFIWTQTLIFGSILMITSTINKYFHSFKRYLPQLQLNIQQITLKWQILEFYERLVNEFGREFGWYFGNIVVVSASNCMQILFAYLGLMLIMFKFFLKNNIKF